MTWSREEAVEQRKKALRLLLDYRDGNFTLCLDWFKQDGSDIAKGVWSLLYEDGLVKGNVIGGAKWRLTVEGWIEACSLLRDRA
jgi:hypothetical protein